MSGYQPLRSESAVQRACLQYLRVMGILHWRNSAVPVRGRRYTGLRGLSDICALIRGRFLAIECKSTTGDQREEQRRFQLRVEAEGGVYVLARSVDDVIRAVEEAGRAGRG